MTSANWFLPSNSKAPARHVPWIPSQAVEYVYFLTIAYSITSTNLGIEVPLVAAGMMVLMAAYCVKKLGSDTIAVSRPIILLLAALVSFIGVQVVFHNASISEPFIRTFVLWACGMTILQSLRLRPGFLQRCTIVLFILGLSAVPHLNYGDAGSVERAGAEIEGGGNLSHPTGLSGWFGFCAVVLAIIGIEAPSTIRRGLYWFAAGACLVIVGLTVSRGPLIGAGMALVVSFRGMLKRGFLPLLVVVVIAGIALETGLLDPIVSSYETRGLEETGRLLLWPYVVERIFAAPFVGVGATDISTYIPEIGTSISTPHNSFLYFALTSGTIPFLLWVCFWIRSGWKAMFGQMQGRERPFQLPILIYLFVNSMLGDINSDPWVLLSLSVAAGSAVVYAKKHRVWVRGIMRQGTKTQYQTPVRATGQPGDKLR